MSLIIILMIILPVPNNFVDMAMLFDVIRN